MVDRYEEQYGGEWRLFQVLGFAGITSLDTPTKPKRKKKRKPAKRKPAKRKPAKRKPVKRKPVKRKPKKRLK